MGIKFEDVGPDEPGQALALIEPTTIVAARVASPTLPKLIADAGEHAALRFLDFFTANIRNGAGLRLPLCPGDAFSNYRLGNRRSARG